MTKPIMAWGDQRAFAKACIWWTRLDNRYQIEVHRTDNDPRAGAPFPAWLYIFDHDNNDKVIHEQGVNLIAGAIFGPDMEDVALWESIALDVVGEPST